MAAEPSQSAHCETNRLLSPTSRINLILLCIFFLIGCAMLVLDFLTSIPGILSAALILSYLLLGPVHFIEDRLAKTKMPPRFRRTSAIISVYLLFFSVTAVALIRVIPPLTLQVREFAQELPTHLSHMPTKSPQARAHSLAELMKPRPGESRPRSPQARQAKIVTATQTLALEKLIGMYRQFSVQAGKALLDIGTTTLTGLVYLLTSLVLVFIILHDGRGLKQGFIDLMPLQYEAGVAEFLERLHRQLYSFTKSQVLISLASGGLMYLLLALLNIKYALLLGIFFGTISILPVIGPWLGLAPITLLLAFTNHPLDILQVLLFAGIFYIIKTYWLWPRLLDRRFDIHPVIFILTFLVCLKLVGYLGILLSFPLASALSVCFDMLRSHQQEE